MWRGDMRKIDEDRYVLASFLNSSLKNNICTSFGRYELVDDNQITQTEIEKYSIRLYDQKEITELLQSAGFRHIKFIKAFEHDRESDEKDEVFVCECQK
jgi:hypothetical protein